MGFQSPFASSATNEVGSGDCSASSPVSTSFIDAPAQNPIDVHPDSLSSLSPMRFAFKSYSRRIQLESSSRRCETWVSYAKQDAGRTRGSFARQDSQVRGLENGDA